MLFYRYPVVYEAHGENAGTPRDPKALWDGGHDLSETVSVFIFPDDDYHKTLKPRYAIKPVVLPEWLPLDEWLYDAISWGWFWGLGGKPEWPEHWQRQLMRYKSGRTRYGLIDLLRCNPDKMRNEFRIKLRGQLIEWLDENPDDRQYPTPLSRRQAECLLGPYSERRYKQTDHALYLASHSTEILGCKPPKGAEVQDIVPHPVPPLNDDGTLRREEVRA